ncbi:ABC transporter substrate-binding protein [Colwellia sp. Arc7-635]|uniref:substrate-binding periplasmic protein n=1 Tax=Colwellia sp. Arc7-635 TaxID=2497879 RepID=UPI000F85ABAD|nr:transporter substrate-binding domain-containing protein [Colwellia sp. Arc7-635]AZQ84348.1 ABC transporter substrate-binding protein [Colwellia sp. Arc7-635]
MFAFKSVCIVFALFIVHGAHAVDHIRMHSPAVGEDKRTMHKDEVLRRALEISEKNFGTFTLDFVNIELPTARALRVIETGKLINVFIAAANDDWDNIATPIKIPVRFGQLSYRLLLVNKNNLDKFKAIDSLSDLKKLTAGSQKGWALNEVLKDTDIEVVTGSNFEGLFLMLNNQRFDFFPRAIYEAYNELENRKNILNNIVVEPTLALYIPTVSYVYVSHEVPQIARRLEYGLEQMVKNGELKTLFNKYYKEDIIRANLQNRKIIRIENSYFSKQDAFVDRNLWLQP